MLSARRALPQVRLISSKKPIYQGGPTVPRFSSIFCRLLQLFPRLEFEQSVKKHRSDYAAKGFSSWGQFVAMLFCQFARTHSLREICGGLASCEGKLKHLGVSDSPKRSTLAYANANRPWSLCQTVFEQLLAKCRMSMAGRRASKKFRFKNKLVSWMPASSTCSFPCSTGLSSGGLKAPSSCISSSTMTVTCRRLPWLPTERSVTSRWPAGSDLSEVLSWSWTRVTSITSGSSS
jgi:hypothetical protein